MFDKSLPEKDSLTEKEWVANVRFPFVVSFFPQESVTSTDKMYKKILDGNAVK
jgi:hypothetical protein